MTHPISQDKAKVGELKKTIKDWTTRRSNRSQSVSQLSLAEYRSLVPSTNTAASSSFVPNQGITSSSRSNSPRIQRPMLQLDASSTAQRYGMISGAFRAHGDTLCKLYASCLIPNVPDSDRIQLRRYLWLAIIVLGHYQLLIRTVREHRRLEASIVQHRRQISDCE